MSQCADAYEYEQVYQTFTILGVRPSIFRWFVENAINNIDTDLYWNFIGFNSSQIWKKYALVFYELFIIVFDATCKQ